MKKSLKLIGFVAAAAATVIGCAKEENVQIPEETAFTHTVTFHTGALATKTVLVEGVSSSAFKWSADDASRFYLTESGVAGTDISITSTDDYETITLSATFSHESAPEEYTYEGVLAKNRTNSNKPRVPATQTSSATSFDPNADVLVAKSQTFATAQSELSLQFARPVAVNKMTLIGLTPGETVNKVTITSDKNITGWFDVAGNAWTGDNHILTVNTDLLVPASGEVSVYFMSMPLEEATLTVVAETEGFKYTKTFGKTISLALQKVNVFGVNNLVKEAKSDLSGYYLIGSYSGSKWQLMSSANGGNFYSSLATNVGTAAASVDFDEFSGVANIDDYIWQVEAYSDGYSIKSVTTNKYVTWESGNYAKAADELKETDVLYIDITGEVATITSKKDDERKLKYNSTNPRFAFYTSAQTGIYMIPATVDPRTPVTLSFDEAVLNYTTANYGDCLGQVVTVEPNVTAITDNILWSYTDEDGIIDDVDPDTGIVALHGTTGSATITATFDGDANYRPATASYTIVVTAADANDGSLEHPFTVSEVKAYMDASASNRGPVYITGKVSSIVEGQNFDGGFGNGTFFISNDGLTEGFQFEAFRINYLGNKSWVTGNPVVAVGDVVLIYGATLTIYNTTYETASNSGSYLYSLNGVVAPSIEKSDIVDVPAAGVSGATTTVSFTNIDGWTPSVEPDGTIVTSASLSGTTITYSVANNTGGARNGSINVILSKDGFADVTATITVSQLAGDGGSIPDPETIVFADWTPALVNGTQYSDPFDGGHFTITFGGGGNDGKYYTTGSGIRTYGGGTITITSANNIAEIEFTWDGSNAPSAEVATPTGYSTDTKKWTGKAKTIVLTRPSGSGHWRLQSVKVTYSE